MEEDILLKSSYDHGAKIIYDAIDSICQDYQDYQDYLDYHYLPQKNKSWSNFKDTIFVSIQKFQSHAMVMINEHNIPKTYQEAVEKFKKGIKEAKRIHALQAKGEFSEKIFEDLLKNEMYHFSITSRVFLAVVSLVHLQETLLKFFFVESHI